jgi:hypothetical protein
MSVDHGGPGIVAARLHARAKRPTLSPARDV